MMLSHVVALTAVSRSRSVWSAHLWHIVEAVAFLVTSLGGIAVAEFVQAKQGKQRHSVTAFSGGGSSSGLRGDSWGTDAYKRAETAVPDAGRRVTLLPLVALAGAAAAGVHFVVMPEHFEEAWLYGTFFLVAATSQLIYSAWLLLRPSRELVIAGVVGNLSVVVLWLVTRTIGIPLGPAAGAVEKVGALDLVAVVFELTTIVGGFVLLRRWQPTHAVRPSTWSSFVWVFASVAITAIAIAAFIQPPS